MKGRDNSGPTHAGGVVYRVAGDGIRYLLVTAKRTPDHWVFPKGHIEKGEVPRETAVREVREESGVRAKVVRPLGTIAFSYRGKQVRSRFFLLVYESQTEAEEDRASRWCGFKAARALLSFENSRALLDKAHGFLSSDA